MGKNPNVLTAEDYFDLSLKDRGLLDDWIKSLGGRPNKTKTIILDRESEKVTIIEYHVEHTHGKNYAKNVMDGETEKVFSYTEPPPVWKD